MSNIILLYSFFFNLFRNLGVLNIGDAMPAGGLGSALFDLNRRFGGIMAFVEEFGFRADAPEGGGDLFQQLGDA